MLRSIVAVMFRRKRGLGDADVGFLAPGWIEPVIGPSERVLFDAGDGVEPRWLGVLARGTNTMQQLPWKAIEWVRLEAFADIPAGLISSHSEDFAACDEGDIVLGGLRPPDDSMFVLVPMGFRSGAQWLELFRSAGVTVSPPDWGRQ